VNVKAWETLAEARTPDGSAMRLSRHDGEYVIWVDGRSLMSSRAHGSEESLAEAGCGHLRDHASPRVLVGGLGMGFTLRAALDVLPPRARVVVAELVPEVVEWNRGPLGPLGGHPLRDKRVRVAVEDVGHTLRAQLGRFDAILLDVDNGPAAFTSQLNESLYGATGVAAAHAALAPGGVLAVWSAWDDDGFTRRLHRQGFAAHSSRVRARREKRGAHHTIFVGVKPQGYKPG
jgi:spermidine synthase